MTVKPIPTGYHTVTPYLVVKGVAQLIDFLKQAFDGEEVYGDRMSGVKDLCGNQWWIATHIKDVAL